MQKNHRIFLGVIIAIFVLITTATIFFTWEDSEIINKWITGGLLIANLSVAVLIFFQIRQSKNQFIDLNRPWLHLHVGKITENIGGGGGYNGTRYEYFPLILENSGNLTARNVKIESDDQFDKLLFGNQNFDEFYPQHKKTLLESISGVSVDATDVITITLSYNFASTKITKTYHLSQKVNEDPILSDITPHIRE